MTLHELQRGCYHDVNCRVTSSPGGIMKHVIAKALSRTKKAYSGVIMVHPAVAVGIGGAVLAALYAAGHTLILALSHAH